MEEQILVKHLFKSYRNTLAVKDLSFSVEKGQCVAFLGPNGAGKTTTLKVLYNKAERDKRPETEVRVFGLDPKKHELAIKSRIGLVPQENSLDSQLDVVNNLFIYARLNGMDMKKAAKRIDHLLQFMDLEKKRESLTLELSGGMQRRLIIARALINSPDLLILDEPTTGLDPQVRHTIWKRMRELKQQGVTILLTTHYMEEAFELADHIVIMDQGKKVMEGNPVILLREHIEPFVLEIFSGTNGKMNAKHLSSIPNLRCEEQGDKRYCYGNDINQLSELASEFERHEFFIRQSNLEDLFLKITGRNLNAIQ